MGPAGLVPQTATTYTHWDADSKSKSKAKSAAIKGEAEQLQLRNGPRNGSAQCVIIYGLPGTALDRVPEIRAECGLHPGATLTADSGHQPHRVPPKATTGRTGTHNTLTNCFSPARTCWWVFVLRWNSDAGGWTSRFPRRQNLTLPLRSVERETARPQSDADRTPPVLRMPTSRIRCGRPFQETNAPSPKL